MQWRLLAGVPEEEVRRVLSVARRRRFARHEVVFHRDDPADSLHLIVSGHFAIQIMTPLGERATLGVRGPGEWFGEMALVAEAPRRSATIVALEAAETFAVYQGEFERLRKQHPAVNDVLTAFLASEVRLLDERLLEALYVPAERRLLRRLCELAELYGGGDSSEVPLTQEQLAALSGTSRATVNRVLREEERRGTVALRRGTTFVLDRDVLARRAR